MYFLNSINDIFWLLAKHGGYLYELETGADNEDDVLIGDSLAEVSAEISYSLGIDHLPHHWQVNDLCETKLCEYFGDWNTTLGTLRCFSRWKTDLQPNEYSDLTDDQPVQVMPDGRVLFSDDKPLCNGFTLPISPRDQLICQWLMFLANNYQEDWDASIPELVIS